MGGARGDDGKRQNRGTIRVEGEADVAEGSVKVENRSGHFDEGPIMPRSKADVATLTKGRGFP